MYIFRGGYRGQGILGAVDGESVSHDRCAQDIFWCRAEWPQAPGKPGKARFPRLLHPGYFLMPRNGPRRQGKPGGMCFPRSPHPGTHQSRQGTTNHPVPVIHPYLECPVAPLCRNPPPQRIRKPREKNSNPWVPLGIRKPGRKKDQKNIGRS